MRPRALDMLQDPTDHARAGPVAEAVDVDLDRVLEELVDEDGVIGRDRPRLRHVAFELALRVHDLHRPPAEDVVSEKH